MRTHNPALSPLQGLIGTWDVQVGDSQWQESFEWLENAFIAWRSEKVGDFPQATCIIGRNENQAPGTYVVLYADDRGVSRIYNMTFQDGVLTLLREDPDFFQRFEGKLDSGGNTIAGRWETATDGSDWKRDFDILYRRRRP